MMEVFVDSVGLIAPGLVGWPAARPILRGDAPYVWQDLPVVAPVILPATERRRCIASARLALTTAYEAFSAVSSPEPRPLACVFASSDGDGQVIRQIADGLAQDEPDVSPTRFSNSVHNAAAGYWSIAAGLKQASTTICAFDETFAAALLDASTQALDEQTDVLMTAFDICFPEPFSQLRPTAVDCAVSLILTAQRSTQSIARLHIALTDRCPASPMPADLPQSFYSNPAARALPLLAALAIPSGQTICLDYLDQTLTVTLTP
jgi:hypothetical protein